ncbi:unnamed protein product [Linum trigynum]|uniref:Protein FAR1-RELATED SEQUENCE n=1 Tax=Linum trigynum TaxID=586398 RepID=A0AAV2D403_9ROSI
MTAVQYTFRVAHEKGYYVQYMDDRNVLTHLFLAHPESVVMLRAWHHVIVIDATYKANKYDMPWVEIVGMTPVGLNFVIASVNRPLTAVSRQSNRGASSLGTFSGELASGDGRLLR